MIRFLKLLLIALIAIVLLGFAFANRNEVIISFDPFARARAPRSRSRRRCLRS